MANPNLDPSGLRNMSYRSIPVVRVPNTTTARGALVGRFNTAMADLHERARQANIPVVSPQFQPLTTQNVTSNARKFWNSTLRPLVVPARRHA